MASVRIGISGWRYPPWRRVFYPGGWPQRRELEFAAQHFSTIEINGSFYSLQRPEYYETWRAHTPPGFVFAVKGGRFITHMKKLRDVQPALSNFLASGVLALREKLGPILWQFPESMPPDLERFAAFFELLPGDTTAAAALAARHGPLLVGRSCIVSDQHRPLRHAVEVRNPATLTPDFFALLRRHAIAWVIADTAGRWPYAEDITSDFVYVRLHGDKALYKSGYSQPAILRWADRIQRWSRGAEPADAARITLPTCSGPTQGRDVYVYFDNDIKVHAPFDALALHRAVGLPPWQTGAPLRERRRPGRRYVEDVPRSGGERWNRARRVPVVPRPRGRRDTAWPRAPRRAAVRRRKRRQA